MEIKQTFAKSIIIINFEAKASARAVDCLICLLTDVEAVWDRPSVERNDHVYYMDMMSYILNTSLLTHKRKLHILGMTSKCGVFKTWLDIYQGGSYTACAFSESKYRHHVLMRSYLLHFFAFRKTP